MKLDKKNAILNQLIMVSAVLAAIPAAQAATSAQTLSALRIAGMVTDGTMPTSAPEFAQMVTAIEANNYVGAATIAANSKYFAGTLARRLAKQMMNPVLDATVVPKDNDATAFLVAHFAGAQDGNGGALPPSISKIWSDNVTCRVNVGGTATKAFALTGPQLAAVNWASDVVCTPGQTARDAANTANTIAIPAKHVGGYVTLSGDNNDASFAQTGAQAGTNLRMIEGLWTISMGLSLPEMASVVGTSLQNVPRFVPSKDPNFVQGNNQAACISCHAGGVQSLHHGYAAVADIFDYDPNNNGFIFRATPGNNQKKSLGSDAGKRGNVNTCNMTTFSDCNADASAANLANQAWDVSATWSATGLLSRMGWPNDAASLSGQGLNALGAAIGRASLPYAFLTSRAINEICPLGTFSADQINAIASEGKSSDDLRRIVARVASDVTCR